MPGFLSFVSRLFFSERGTEIHFIVLPRGVFLCFAGFFWQIYHALAQKPVNFLWKKLKETGCKIEWKQMEDLKSG